MALGIKSGALLGVAVGVGIGIGLAVMAPTLFPRTARAARPLLKRAAREGVGAYMRAREGLAEFGEYVEDLIAEVSAEVGAHRGDGAETGAAAAADKPTPPEAPPAPGNGAAPGGAG